MPALHKGNETAKTLEVWVDNNEWVHAWTSSGTTLDFETILMPAPGMIGQEVTLRAVLREEEWIDITEVRTITGNNSEPQAGHPWTNPKEIHGRDE